MTNPDLSPRHTRYASPKSTSIGWQPGLPLPASLSSRLRGCSSGDASIMAFATAVKLRHPAGVRRPACKDQPIARRCNTDPAEGTRIPLGALQFSSRESRRGRKHRPGSPPPDRRGQAGRIRRPAWNGTSLNCPSASNRDTRSPDCPTSSSRCRKPRR